MEKRIKTAIQKITLNDYTFSGVSFEPTLINFFFGITNGNRLLPKIGVRDNRMGPCGPLIMN